MPQGFRFSDFRRRITIPNNIFKFITIDYSIYIVTILL